MSDKFRNKYRIESTRLQSWDYRWNGNYFITICTYHKECFFGEIYNSHINYSTIGEVAIQFWAAIPEHFPFVVLDEFVVMPNHMHGIICIDKPPKEFDGDVSSKQRRDRACPVSTSAAFNNARFSQEYGRNRFQNQGKGSLSAIVGSFKSAVTKHANENNIGFAWQERFHDHIIRNEQSLRKIQHYIKNNIANWQDDCYFKK